MSIDSFDMLPTKLSVPLPSGAGGSANRHEPNSGKKQSSLPSGRHLSAKEETSACPDFA
jgi:hypothetical protein